MNRERTVLIRCDASERIGLGHVARCAALAHALRDCGARPIFVVCDEPLATDRLRRERFETHRFPAAAPAPHAPLPDWDVTRTLELARSSGAETVVVDHYGAREGWLRRAAAAGVHLGVIDDDGCDRDLSCADFVLAPGTPAAGSRGDGTSATADRRRATPDESRAGDAGRAGQLCMYGPRYALVHPAFRQARVARERVTGHDSDAPLRVLVTLGGGDTERAALVVEALENVSRPIELRCAAAQRPEHAGPLAAAVSAGRCRAELVAPCVDLSPHAAWADLAVCGAGATCLELCCAGVPLVAIALAANQHGNLRTLRSTGAAMCLGEWNDSTPREISAFVRTLVRQHELRRELSRRATRLIDGLGGERAARAILLQAEKLEGTVA